MPELGQKLILLNGVPVVLGDFQHEAGLILDCAEPVPDGDRPCAIVGDLDGLGSNSVML